MGLYELRQSFDWLIRYRLSLCIKNGSFIKTLGVLRRCGGGRGRAESHCGTFSGRTFPKSPTRLSTVNTKHQKSEHYVCLQKLRKLIGLCLPVGEQDEFFDMQLCYSVSDPIVHGNTRYPLALRCQKQSIGNFDKLPNNADNNWLRRQRSLISLSVYTSYTCDWLVDTNPGLSLVDCDKSLIPDFR